MKALIYDPYLDTAGGGERYMLAAASLLAKQGYQVDIFWKDEKIKNWLAQRLGIDFSPMRVVDTLSHGIGYDVVFWLSDGSIPVLLAKRNVVHFQTPFSHGEGKRLFNRLKKAKIDAFVCNSYFTKKVIDREFGVHSQVVYPPINTEFFVPGKKENSILYVGRYSRLQQLKRQDLLVDAFKGMCDRGLKKWRLALVGGSEIGGREFVEELKMQARGYPIDVLENLPLEEVQKAYAKATFFWSASGYGVNEESQPSHVEHFGMSVVEAMSAGCIPLVVNKGGHKEIISDGVNGFLWETLPALQETTSMLMKDERRRKSVLKNAIKKSKDFSVTTFEKSIYKVFTS